MAIEDKKLKNKHRNKAAPPDGVMDMLNAMIGDDEDQVAVTSAKSKPTRTRLKDARVDIFNIYPDTLQPRRVLPSTIRAHWNGDPESIPETLNHWWKLVSDERGGTFYLEGYVRGSETDRSNEEGNEIRRGPLEESFLALVDLAASIYRDGLSNPITVAELHDSTFQIETGERRWLAYHLLSWLQDDAEFSRIPAKQVESVSIWRQANENNVRKDLNAVGLARQFALLLMDLHGQDKFQILEEFEHEREFYAQVSDGNEWRIPRGEGEKLVNAMGLSHVQQLRQFRAILRSPNDFWDFADDNNLPEFQIRKYAENDYTVAVATVSKKFSEPKWYRTMENLENDLVKRWSKMKSTERKKIRKTLTILLDKLDNLDGN